MNSKLTIVGFGVIGVESLYALVKKINKNKRIKISVIEKIYIIFQVAQHIVRKVLNLVFLIIHFDYRISLLLNG